MPGTPRGLRRDSRIANQRRLDLIRRLLRGPASADALIADLRASLGDDIYPADARAALRHDIAALRETFGCEFFFRAGEGYFLTSLGTLTLYRAEQVIAWTRQETQGAFRDVVEAGGRIHVVAERAGTCTRFSPNAALTSSPYTWASEPAAGEVKPSEPLRARASRSDSELSWLEGCAISTSALRATPHTWVKPSSGS